MDRSIHVDFNAPANAGLLRYLSRSSRRTRSMFFTRDRPGCSPNEVAKPYINLGTHPDVVEHLWDVLGKRLPRDCRWVVYGSPVLACPSTGIIFAFGGGTLYALRLPPNEFEQALRAGLKRLLDYREKPEMGMEAFRFDLDTIGPGWVFGKFLKAEEAWCQAAYRAAMDKDGMQRLVYPSPAKIKQIADAVAERMQRLKERTTTGFKEEMYVDFDAPANGGVLRYLSDPERIHEERLRIAIRSQPSCSPARLPALYANLSMAPPTLDRLWGELTEKLPEDCRWIVYGAPVLVHPSSGVIFGIGVNYKFIHYALRLPPREYQKALAAGNKRVLESPGNAKLRIPSYRLSLEDFGKGWVFGSTNHENPPQEEQDWCLAAYQQAGGENKSAFAELRGDAVDG